VPTIECGVLVKFEDIVQSLLNMYPGGLCSFDPHLTTQQSDLLGVQLRKGIKITLAYRLEAQDRCNSPQSKA
jgi:hypothetical protein